MSYTVHELFFTLQGEGAQAGRASVFCRFAGCNLWSGREEDRATAQCTFCDTVFVGPPGPGGGKFRDAAALAEAIAASWDEHVPAGTPGTPYVVFTGGEPLLQLDNALIDATHARGFEIAVETNGTVALPTAPIDWVCVSPKTLKAPLRVTRASEVKLVYPQPAGGPTPADIDASGLQAAHWFIQPLWVAGDADRAGYMAAAVRYCQTHPRWRLGIQTHKILGLP